MPSTTAWAMLSRSRSQTGGRPLTAEPGDQDEQAAIASSDHWTDVVDLAMSDLRRPPKHLATAVRFGLRLLEQGSPLWNRRFRGEVAPALLTGVATHAITSPRALPAVGSALAWRAPVTVRPDVPLVRSFRASIRDGR